MTIKRTAMLFLLAITLFAGLAMAQTTYQQGGRKMEAFVLLQQEGFTKGKVELAISPELLSDFSPDYVEFFQDGELLAIVNEMPFSITVDFGDLLTQHSVLAIGYRETVIRSRVLPQVRRENAVVDLAGDFSIEIVSPRDGAYALGQMLIAFEPAFSDDARLEAIEIFIDDKLVSTLQQEPWEYEYNFGRGYNGHKISAVAYDSMGRRAEAAISTLPLEESTIFIETRIVSLDVTVTDDRGKFIGGLRQEDFTVKDNGEEQEIRYFSQEERPLWVAILIDTSGSMLGAKIRRSVFAAQQFISQLKPADHAMVVTFGPATNLISEFTDDFMGLIDKVGEINVERDAMTPLNDAVYASLSRFKDRTGRRAIIIISDGADNVSTTPASDVHEAAKENNVHIYSIGIEAMHMAQGMQDNMSHYLLKGLADVTGGDAYFPTSASKFLEIFQTIAEELRSQYTLGYLAPQSEGGRWRKVDLKTSKGKARTREGYYPGGK